MVKAIRSPCGLQLGDPLYPGPELRACVPGPRPGFAPPPAAERGSIRRSSSAGMHPAKKITASRAAYLLYRIARGAGEGGLGDADPERRAHADLALDEDVAAVHLDDLLAYGQPQAAPPGRAGAVLVHPVEPLEELGELLLRDTDAGVPPLHGQRRGVLFYRHVHAPPRLGVLDGVVQQVEEDLVELLGVADAPALTGLIEVDRYAEPLGLGLHGLYGGLDDPAQIRRPDLELVLPRVHLRERQEFLDHPADAPELLVRELERPVLQRVEPLAGSLQQPHGALDRRQGRPELVRDVRDKGGLGPLEGAVLGYVPDGHDDPGLRPPVACAVVAAHLGRVGPVGLVPKLHLPDGDPRHGGLAQALQDPTRSAELFERAPPVEAADAEQPGRGGVRHRHAPLRVRGDECLGGGLEDGFKAALLLLDLTDVVLYLLGHVVERPRDLAQLVPALYRNGGRVVPRGYPYGRVPGLREGARDPARKQKAC